MCNDNNDCATQICNAITKRCAATTCDNGVLDAGEADVDCGGVCLFLCGSGMHCTGNPDCASNECNVTSCM
jgi:hypothetical protein